MPMMSMPKRSKRIAGVGGGAAGLLAAGTALRQGAAVTVFEHSRRPGLKLLLTGKGRCNVTNNCDRDTLLGAVTRNPRFLYTAAAVFPPQAVMELFEELGVPLKTERGQRVFPCSDKSADILAALLRYTEGAVLRHENVTGLMFDGDSVCGLVTPQGQHRFDAVILATGGLSYPLTGSDGSGYALARAAGHTVTPLSPSLVPLTSSDPACREMQGLSLKNVALTLRDPATGKTLYSDFGEMMFTHFGLTGPMILSASAHLSPTGPFPDAMIDLKPALDDATLDARLLSDFARYSNRDFDNALGDLLPAKMIPVMVARSGIDPHKKVNGISREERRRLLRCLKEFTVPITGFRPIGEAIITRGGVALSEVNPRTMASKCKAGLYLAGEMLDLDAYTGGFNLQIAFSTGYLAGLAAAQPQ